jgi:hypothetical protein
MSAVTGELAALAARKCEGCDLVFVPRRQSQAYHSGTCYDRAYNRDHPVLRQRQRALPGESKVERAFAAWIETPAGRYVEAEVARLAREDRAAGDRRGEINLYLALVRRSSRGLTKDRAGFRCNNSFRSLLARRVMSHFPDLAGMFETRELRGRT